VEYEKPEVIIGKVLELEQEIAKDVEKIQEMIP
jgi:hypothetical protein